MSTLSVNTITGVQYFDFANTNFASAFGVANSGYVTANAGYVVANAAYGQSNTLATSANAYASAVGTSTNNYTSATYSTLTQFGSVFGVANAAFGKANNALANTSGVSFNGNFYVPSGNVGIGTSSPTLTLEVQSPVNSSTGPYSAGFITQYDRQGHLSTRRILFTQDNYRSSIQSQYLGASSWIANDLLLNVDGGYVGIGTSSPGANVDIYAANTGVGQASASNLIFRVRDGQDRPPIAAYGYIDGTGLPDATATAVAIRQVSGTGRSLTTTGSVMFGGTGTSTSDFRAPIFYDSDNTGYYLNPAGTSYLYNLAIDNNSANLSYSTLSSIGYDGIIRFTGDITTTANVGTATYIPYIHWTNITKTYGYRQHVVLGSHRDGNNNYGSFFIGIGGNDAYPTTAFYFNNAGSFVASGSLTGTIFYDSDNTSYYVDPAAGSSLNRLTISAGTNQPLTLITSSSGPWALELYRSDLSFSCRVYNDGSGWYFNNYIWGAGSVRGPIFYDSDNTGYYVDPASTSTINSISMNGSLQMNSQWSTFYDTDRNPGSANYYPNVTAQAVRWSFAGSSYTGTGGNYAGVLHFHPWSGTTASTGDASYQLAFGSTAVNGSGNPALNIRNGIDTTWNSWFSIPLYGSNYNTSSLYATLMYDSNNTAYYVDPNGTSVLNALTVGGSTVTPLTRATSVSASGSSVPFTGIPSGVKRITLMLAGVSLNGSDGILLRLGTSSGIESTSYVGMENALTAGQGTGTNQFSSSFWIMGGWTGASYNWSGNVFLTNISGNTWCLSGLIAADTTASVHLSGGYKTLGAVLTQIQMLPSGSNTFDAGTVNILYE